MEHLFREGQDRKTPLLLLHGTGGNEHSLIEIAHLIAPKSPILALRGEVNEKGALRFFKRFEEGKFDLIDLEKRTDHILNVVENLANDYQLPFHQFTLIGYSNGANIGSHILLERPNTFVRGIFFHGMSLGKHEHTFSLKNQTVWLSNSYNDPIVAESSFNALKDAFKKRGASVTTFETSHGHQLTREEIGSAKDWFTKEKIQTVD